MAPRSTTTDVKRYEERREAAEAMEDPRGEASGPQGTSEWKRGDAAAETRWVCGWNLCGADTMCPPSMS